MLRNLLLASAFVLLASSAAWGDEAKEESTDGTWLPAKAELGGQPFPDEIRKSMKLVLKDDTYTLTLGPQVDRGTVKRTPSATPKTMAITGTDGPNKGRTFLAIYEHKGDTLRVCYDLTGKKHPAEFKTEPGSQLFLVEYHRQKDS
jgi:uncharacterized protein (TIGR03067 family)